MVRKKTNKEDEGTEGEAAIAERLSSDSLHSTGRRRNSINTKMLLATIVALYLILSAMILFQTGNN